MSWFDAAGFANLAKSAINSAQKTIDKALDIQDRQPGTEKRQNEDEAFFAAFGIRNKGETSTLKTEKSQRTALPTLKGVTESWNKDGSGFWSDWGSYFEIANTKGDEKVVPSTSTSSDNTHTEPVDSDAKSPPPEDIQSSPKTVLLQPQSSKLFPPQSASTSESKPVIGALQTLSSIVQTKITGFKEVDESEDNISLPSEETLDLNQVNVNTEEESTDMMISTVQDDNISARDKEDIPEIFTSSNVPQPLEDISEIESVEVLQSAEPVLDTAKSNVIAVTEQPKPVVSPPSSSLETADAEYSIICPNETKASMGSSDGTFPGSASVHSYTTIGEESFETIVTPSDMSQVTEELVRSQQDQDTSDVLNQSSETIFAGDIDCQNQGESSPDSIVPVYEDFDTCSHREVPNSLNVSIDSVISSPYNLGTSCTDASFHTLMEGKDCESEYSSSISPADDCDLVKLCKEGFETLQTEECAEARELNDCDAKSVDRLSQRTSSSGSFVQCSVEDADGIPHNCQSPNSTTPSERSDNIRLCSEQNSGHTSDDEVETATSSDIEIISSPAGDHGDRHISSPMKHVWTPRMHRSRCSDSPASDSSKEGILPVLREVEESITEHGRFKGRGSLAASKVIGRPRETPQIDKLLKKVEELQEILEARERKVLELCKENGELQETNNSLRSQIQQLEEAQLKESQGVSSMTQEFTQRLTVLESKLQETSRERDLLKKQLIIAKEEAASRLSASEMETIIKEKEQQVSELMEEGEKLSKQQLHQSNIIKKLRAKEKEMENLIKSQKEKLEEQSRDLDRISKSLSAKDEQEKKHIDAIRQLTTTVQQQEKELLKFRSDAEDSMERVESLKTALDAAYKQITELQRISMEKETEVQETMLSAEMVAREKLQHAMDQEQQKTEHEKKILLAQIDDLRLSLATAEKRGSKREDVLRQDIADLQQRLQSAEARNEELSQSMSAATRPLLRQIENLQSNFNTQVSSWERIERSLTERLGETQTQLQLAIEREKSVSEKYQDVKAKLSSIESERDALMTERLSLLAELEAHKQKLSSVEDNKASESGLIEEMKKRFKEEMNELKLQNERLQLQLQHEREHNELERKRVQQLHEELREKERRFILGDTGSHRSATPSPPMSRISSVSESHWNQEDFMDQSLTMSTISASGFGRMSVYDSLRIGNAATLVENLQSQLKQREGEISQLHSEIAQLERTRESMTQELVYITDKSGQLEVKLAELQHLEKSFQDMEQKYNTLLQMYGEKVEEAEELRLDLQDIKSMYRAQLDELTRKS